MIQLNGTLYRRRLRDQYLPCAVCHGEIDYDASPGMDHAFHADLRPDGRLQPVHYVCAEGGLRG